jgi:imidazolonepropionase-like amidohydrolase
MVRLRTLMALGVATTLGACEPTGDPPHVPSADLVKSPCPAAQGARGLVFANVRVFDGERTTAGDVRVSGGRIESLGEVADRCNADVIDGAGKTLLPGLVDAHTHAYGKHALAQAAAFGVTTEIEMFGDPRRIRALREADARGERPAEAALWSAGILATAPGGHGTEYGFPIPTLTSPREADAFVAARLAEGSDFLKIVIDDGAWFRGKPNPTLDAPTAAALVIAAHARGVLAVAHIGTQRDAQVAIDAGVDGLAHLFVDGPADDGFAKSVAAHHAFVIPTLGVLAVVTGSPDAGTWADGAGGLAGLLGASELQRLRAHFPLTPPGARLAYAEQAVASLAREHVPVLAGTDAANPGVVHGASLHREIELLVHAGLPPTEALAAATSVPARCFHLEDRGRIAPGLRADLLLVDGDPTRDVRATRKIVGVWRAGVAVDRDAFLARAHAAPPGG